MHTNYRVEHSKLEQSSLRERGFSERFSASAESSPLTKHFPGEHKVKSLQASPQLQDASLVNGFGVLRSGARCNCLLSGSESDPIRVKASNE